MGFLLERLQSMARRSERVRTHGQGGADGMATEQVLRGHERLCHALAHAYLGLRTYTLRFLRVGIFIRCLKIDPVPKYVRMRFCE